MKLLNCHSIGYTDGPICSISKRLGLGVLLVSLGLALVALLVYFVTDSILGGRQAVNC